MNSLIVILGFLLLLIIMLGVAFLVFLNFYEKKPTQTDIQKPVGNDTDAERNTVLLYEPWTWFRGPPTTYTSGGPNQQQQQQTVNVNTTGTSATEPAAATEPAPATEPAAALLPGPEPEGTLEPIAEPAPTQGALIPDTSGSTPEGPSATVINTENKLGAPIENSNPPEMFIN